MSRQELAEAVNAYLWETYRQRENLDETDIGKLERGDHRWPGKRRREAFRAVLKVATDAEIGFYIIRSPVARTSEIVILGRGRTDERQPPSIADRQSKNEASYRSRDAGQRDLVRMAGAAWFAMLPEDLVDLPGPWATDMEVPARIEAPHVKALNRSIALFERWDHQYGGGLARAAMAGQMDWVCRAARQSAMTDEVRKSWLSNAARLGDLAGWTCFDAGENPDIAERYFLTAIALAGEAGDTQQRTHTATSMSRHLTYLGRTDEALDVIDLARLGWRQLPPLGRAVIGIVEARAYGKVGDGEACRKAVELCDDNFAASPPDGRQDLTWGYYADDGQILGDAGHAMFDIAMVTGDEEQAALTIDRLERAYALHPPDTVRSKALTMVRIACLKTQHGDRADGLDDAEAALADARIVRSHRVIDDLHLLDAALQHPRHRVDERVRAIRAGIAAVISGGV